MNKPASSLPPLEYLPESARGNTVEKQIQLSNNTRGSYISPDEKESSSDFYSELYQKNERSMEKFKKAAKSNPFVPIGKITQNF